MVETRVPGDVLVHLRRARDHIDKEYAEPLDLEVLGKVAGLSKWPDPIQLATGCSRPPTAAPRRPTCPSAFQARWPQAPRIPGCYVLMRGLVHTSASQEKPPTTAAE